MYPVDGLILLAGTLLLLAIVSTTLSGRLGVPGLVLFIGIGMLAGEEGIGGIAFDDHALAHAVGTVALVLILFDGGLQTKWTAFRAAWRPAVALATVGVVATAGITGAAAAWLLDIPILTGLLLGSIVGSTDAAAVFSILRGQGLQLKERIAATLEIESGSNDPMAVLLTLVFVALALGELRSGSEVVLFFLRQAVIGVVGGMLVGRLGAWACSRISLTAVGLYPAFVLGIGLAAYGIPAYLGGSGFLSVYLAGLVIGNANIVFRRGVFLAHDGGAWIAQIAMFVTLGLLSTPSRVMDVALEGFLVAMVLMFLARPLAVFGTLFPFHFSLRELSFLSWVGLKGAIPIILATYPLVRGVPQGDLLFNVVFFVVLLSALTQGWMIPAVAGWMKVRKEVPDATPPVTLEINSIRHLEGDIVEYRVEPGARAAGRRIRELALPESAVIAMIARGDDIIPPRGTTAILPDDYVFVMLKPEVRPFVDRMFSLMRPDADRSADFLELPMGSATRVGDLEDFYGIHLDPNPDRTLADLMQERLGADVREGAEILAGDIRLVVRSVVGGRIELVGVDVPIDP